jgi:hypothetical protein
LRETVPPPIDPTPAAGGTLCVVAEVNDALLRCGGALLEAARRGPSPAVLVLAGPTEDPSAIEAALADPLRRLGVETVRADASDDPAAAVERACAERAPTLLLVPSAAAVDPARRRAAEAVGAALEDGPERTLWIYGGRAAPGAGELLDLERGWRAKRSAVRALDGPRGVLAARARARDRATALGRGDIARAEAFTVSTSSEWARVGRELEERAWTAAEGERLPATTAVLSSFNKRDDVRENLRALFAQRLPFARVIVVDNASEDGTCEMVRAEFPEVTLIEMPHSRFGACETFNIGFRASRTPLTAILDDDIVMPPDWLEKATRRLVAEPETTAVLSSKVVEPGMPESYRDSPGVNVERYMSTFRGCASLAWTEALREAELYDERLFIYGNERDLTCRLLNLGYRVLQYPGVEVFHRTPFGLKPGARSLYFHARNAWLSMLKYAPASDLARMPILVLSRVLLRSRSSEERGEVTDAVGTIGTAAALRETSGAWWIVSKAALSVAANIPYCLRRRRPVRADDFELPLR